MAAFDKSLAPKIQQYAYNLIATQLTKEIEDQFEAWIGEGSFVNDVGDAIEAATKAQLAVIEESDKKRRESMERALFVFSLIAPLALSWMAGSLQYIVGPKLFSKSVSKNIGTTMFTQTVVVENKVASKMLADAGKDLVSRGLPAFVAVTTPKRPELAFDANNTTNGLTLKANFEKTIKAQRDNVVANVMAIAEALNANPDAGMLLIKAFRKASPAEIPRETEQQFQIACQNWINDIVNDARQAWAEAYPIYGMDPPDITPQRLARDFERRMWAAWLIQNDFRAWDRYQNDYRPSIGPGKTGVFLEEDIAVHILSNFTGLHTLQLQYENDERFTYEAINSLVQWSRDTIREAPLNKLAGTKRELGRIEKYFTNKQKAARK